MDSNTYSTRPPAPPEPPDGLAGLPAVVDELEAEDLDQLTDSALTKQILELQREADRLAGQWLRRLAAADTRGAAGADHGQPAASTASWLRTGCAWVPERPAKPYGPPGPCSAARSPEPPRP